MNSDETRVAVLGALNLIYSPLMADDLAMVAQVAEGVELGEDDLVELAEADRRDFFSGSERPVWICPAIEYAGGAANDEFFTRSDWAVRERVVRDVLSESQEIWLLWRFGSLMETFIEKRLPKNAAVVRLQERIDDLSIHLPESRLAERRSERGEQTNSLATCYELAEDMYGELVSQERVAQRDAIEVLERLPLPTRYFGVS
ncbi:hypothetical protein [Amycolatopsis vastitatis]|uniref:Uncharacterized protein n=1 Tax=Amycolatopsis vastitatis TaxID=1905142 RepID=A0A229TBJ6_9PSEU|nr:hypothetical protein [Amycolatopsis vastitatis]OXM68538.1 hypothetical protein CF165_13665 [Amycolatopsis vastitatis]